jgi:hypothetical protein
METKKLQYSRHTATSEYHKATRSVITKETGKVHFTDQVPSLIKDYGEAKGFNTSG